MALLDWLFGTRASTIDLMGDGLRTAYPPGVKPLGQGVSASEFGVSGTENFGGTIRGEDFNPELDDFQRAVKTYDKMRRTDAQIRSMLQVIKLPLRGATWNCEAASSDPVDQKIAAFCNKALFGDDSMDESWDYTLRHILLQLDFGFSVLEKVWKVDRDGYYRYKKLAPRLPRTIYEWHTNRDGSLKAIVQYAPVQESNTRPSTGGRLPSYTTTASFQYLTIPADYAAVFSLEREGDNYAGWSVLRTVYRNWWFKDQAYRTMGVGLDRWGVGIPVANLEPGHGLSKGELDQLRKVLQAIRSNERAYLVAPPFVKFSILGGGDGTTGNLGIAWIDHNDSQIARNVLAGFLTMGRDTKGTLGFGTRLTDMFISSLNGLAGGISADLKRQVIRPLCDVNFDMSNRQYPTPVCLDLEQVELSNLLDVMSKLTGTVLTPQDDDESILRKMLGLPKLHPKNSRTKKAQGPEGGAPPEAGVPPNGTPPPGAPPDAKPEDAPKDTPGEPSDEKPDEKPEKSAAASVAEAVVAATEAEKERSE
jgi:hypothetical protein